MSWYAYLALLALVGLERIAELVVSGRNLRWARRRGGVEHGPRTTRDGGAAPGPAGRLCCRGVLAFRPFLPWLGWPMLALVLAAQALRWWCIGTLGRRWNTRVWWSRACRRCRAARTELRHPNYVAVVVEGIALPLVHTAWVTATSSRCSTPRAAGDRIRVENLALTAAYPSTGHPDPPTGPIRQVPPQPPRGTEPPGPPDQAAS